jgi:parallel beta-helix repeat protein
MGNGITHASVGTSITQIEFESADAHVGDTGRANSYVVAANDAPDNWKNQSDGTGDGSADDVTVQTYIDLLPTNGGSISLTTGTYVWANATTVTRAINGITVRGTGVGTYLTGDGTTAQFTAGGNNWILEDFKTDTTTAVLLTAMGATTGWEWHNVTTSDGYFALRTNSGSIITSTLTDSGLTSGRIPIAGVGGLIGDSANLTWDGSADTDAATLSDMGTLGASAWVVANDAPATIKTYATTLQAAGYPVWVCDGTADQLDISAAAAVGYLEIVLSIGSYSWSANFTPVSNMHIYADGATITLADGANSNMVNTSGTLNNITIEGGVWDGNQANQTSGGQLFRLSGTAITNVTIKNTEIKNARLDAITTTGASASISILNNYIHDCLAYGVDVGGSTGVLVDGNRVEGTGQYGIAFNGSAHECQAVNNRLANNTGRGITAIGVAVNLGYGNIISANTILNSNSNDIHLNYQFSCTVSANTIKWSTGTKTGSGEGIDVVNSNTISVSGNTITGMAHATGANGITLETCTGCTVEANTSSFNGNGGIHIHNSSKNTVNSNITHDNAVYGIDLSSTATYNIVTANQCYDTTSIQDYGILEAEAANNNQIKNNILYDNTVANLVKVGANTTVEGNTNFIASGETRSVSGALTAGNANAIAFAFHDTELQDCYITKVVSDVTTAGGTASSVLQVGIADDAAGTNLGSEFFTGLDLNAIALNDSWNPGDTGAMTKFVLIQDSASATDGWIVGKILTQNAASLAGKYYIYYTGK